MLPERPRTNVSLHLADNFKLEQERFLSAQMQFKSGRLFFGSVAASLLTSMFYILPAGRIIAKDKEEKTNKASEFVDALDAFRIEVYKFARIRGVDTLSEITQPFPITKEYIELDNKFDAMVRKFYMIMFETGFSA